MNEQWCSIIRELSSPRAPVPTGEAEKLQFLADIRAVFFDIYGTLFISSSGEICTATIQHEPERDGAGRLFSQSDEHALAIGEIFFKLFAIAIQKLPAPSTKIAVMQCQNKADYKKLGIDLIYAFEKSIREEHKKKRQEGIPWPEVDVRKTWSDIIGDLFEDLKAFDFRTCVDRWAIEYEVRTNPVWPMPDVADCIDRLDSANLTLGIISNAQFYTPLLFPALIGRPLEDLAIPLEMQYYSYCEGRSKPDPSMFHQAQQVLAAKGIKANQTLYVGNDMLNDIMPAAQVGFRTALFAADQRSLRMRQGDPLVAKTVPDIIATTLKDVVECVVEK